MLDYRKYMKRIEDKLYEIYAADRNQGDPWWNIVMKGLNEISKDCALELQNETKSIWNEISYQTGFDEAPPTRLLALEIALAGWIGWIMQQKHGRSNKIFSSDDCWKRIEEAYNYGVELSIRHEIP
jgi:hypothetical protein